MSDNNKYSSQAEGGGLLEEAIMHKPTLTLQLTAAELDRLRWLAAQLGLTIGRGSNPDQGSIRQLLQTLASGDAYFVLASDDTEYGKADLICQLAEQNPDISVLQRLDKAMDLAGHLYYDFPDGQNR